jgi:hypothetical protein
MGGTVGGGSGGTPVDAGPGAADTRSGPDAASPTQAAGPGVLMRGYNLQRTSANPYETKLTPALLTGDGFGKLFCRAVDDEIYGQILYVPGVDFGANGKHDVNIVVTMNDSVYAFDAVDGTAPALWEKHLADPTRGVMPVPSSDLAPSTCGAPGGGGYGDISHLVGITSTPALDLATRTIYLVARTKEPGPVYVHRLHALDLVTGAERIGSPVPITASMAGTGAGTAGGTITFDPMRQNQRAGLLLHQGVVYIAFASHCDDGPFHGWMLGYDAASLRQVVVFNDTPGGINGGIWMAGQAPAVDETGDIYLVSANGTADLAGGPNRGSSFMRLRRQGNTLSVIDWFTPFNYTALENEDRDLGASGAVLIPGTNIVLGGSKEGKLYLVDRTNFGKHSDTQDNVIQVVAVTGDYRAHIHGTPAYWKSSAGEYVYVMAEEDALRQYQLSGGRLVVSRISTIKAPFDPGFKPGGYTMPGGMLAISSNGEQAGTGLLWVTVPIAKDANRTVVPGVLRVFNADNITTELWNSEQNSARDSFGSFAKFNTPTIYNSRAYIPTFSRQYCVYGMLK